MKNDKILNDTSKKKKNLWFCSVTGHITTGCPTKINIRKLINGDELINLLKDKCSFRSIKNDEVRNSYRSVID